MFLAIGSRSFHITRTNIRCGDETPRQSLFARADSVLSSRHANCGITTLSAPVSFSIASPNLRKILGSISIVRNGSRTQIRRAEVHSSQCPNSAHTRALPRLRLSLFSKDVLHSLHLRAAPSPSKIRIESPNHFSSTDPAVASIVDACA